MLSKSQIKYIRSLSLQKYRKQHKAYVAEGDKICREWIKSDCRIDLVAAVPEWLEEMIPEIRIKHPETAIYSLHQDQLSMLSSLQTPHQVLLVANMPEQPSELPLNESILVLDEIQDPGNMGTLMRTADWFGLRHIVCSQGTVDIYNPKVVQAAMGSHLRLEVHYTSLEAYLPRLSVPVYAASLEGESVFDMVSSGNIALLLGNEGRGISSSLMELADKVITIPGKGSAESLNVAVSAGILCAFLWGNPVSETGEG